MSVDRIAFDIFKLPSFTKESERKTVLSEANYRIEDILWEDYPVIYDGNVNTREWQDQLKELTTRLNIPIVCIYIKTPTELSRERALKPRYGKTTKVWRVVSTKQFEDRLEEFTQPNHKENLIEISGTEPFDQQLKQFIESISKIKL